MAVERRMQWSLVAVVVALMVVAHCVQSSTAGPVDRAWNHRNEGCTGEILTLCQRCAKSTKSEIVYPMCCEDKEDARTWCNRYLNYGYHTDQ